MKSVILASAVGSVVLWVAYSVVMLVLITRKDVAEAFSRVELLRRPREVSATQESPPPLPPRF